MYVNGVPILQNLDLNLSDYKALRDAYHAAQREKMNAEAPKVTMVQHNDNTVNINGNMNGMGGSSSVMMINGVPVQLLI